MSDDGDRKTPVMPELAGDVTPVVKAEEVDVPAPWERQRGEGEREWTCFKTYRDMNPRNLHNCGMVGQIRVASAELSAWYRKWSWDARVEAYDVLTDRIVQAQRKRQLEQSVDDINADNLAILGTLRKFLSLEAGKYLEASADGGSIGLIKPADLKGLIEAVIKMQRLIHGETTENVGVETDLSDMPMDELRAWHERLKSKGDLPKKNEPS